MAERKEKAEAKHPKHETQQSKQPASPAPTKHETMKPSASSSPNAAHPKTQNPKHAAPGAGHPKPETGHATQDTKPASPAPAAPAAPAPAPASKEDEAKAAKARELEKAFFSLKLYPVAVKEDGLGEALSQIRNAYEKGDDTVKQMVLYMAHEYISNAVALRGMRNYDFFKGKTPNAEPGQLRMNVYRAMFDYNNSLEGLLEVIKLLGTLEGNADDAAKVLTHHFSFLCTAENETVRMLRNAVIDALGKSKSGYALRSLLEYAKYTDDDRILARLAEALGDWEEKIDTLKVGAKEKEKLRAMLHEVMTKELGATHYG